ncbi:DNA ligase D [Candidatus Curtissbacteria bacterium]|nr:DNA ligase D [Candidatus Curtissbacteria bacterium]
MLTTLIDKPFNDIDWVFEIKWDGYRAIAELENGKARLYSRQQITFKNYPTIVRSLEKINSNAIFDGEIVILDKNGKASFQKLQNYQGNSSDQIAYFVFDLLYFAGYDLRDQTLISRKQILKEILPPLSNVKFSDHFEEKGIAFFKAIKEQNLEGIIAKKKTSFYLMGIRSKNWLKIKTHLSQEAIICGYTEPRGGRKFIGALILGIYKNNKLTYVGHTGTGFGDRLLKDLFSKLRKIQILECPFEKTPKTNAPVVWVKPKIVCEVVFGEWTQSGFMRQPVFKGLRIDKTPKEITVEKSLDNTPSFPTKLPKKWHKKFSISNPDKIYWPEEKIEKKDLVDYYNEVSDFIMPYLVDRPESLHRYPDGIHGESFYQKDIQEHPNWIKTVKIHSDSEDKNINYLLCQNKETLLYLINLGCIDLNPWNSRIQNLDYPDYFVIDLDPQGIKFSAVIESALVVKEILDKLGIKSFPKTSGATGLHIYIPVGAKYTYSQVKQFSEIIVRQVHRKIPEITSIQRSPAKRLNHVYLDYLQNRHGQTLAAPYSVRPVPGATISTPLTWEEINKNLSPTQFNFKNVIKRIKIKGDIFKPVLLEKTDIEKSLAILNS